MARSHPKRVCGIYTITSPSGRVYVGQSRHVYQRFRFYRYDKRKGTQPALDASFRKYGVSAHRFEVVHWLPANVSQSRLDYFEQLYMDSYRARGGQLLNAKEGGYRGGLHPAQIEKIRSKLLGHSVSVETRKKISIASKGRKHTASAKEKAGRVWKGRKRGPMSDEHREKLSQRRMGREPWNKGKTGVYKPETIEKIRTARAAQPKIVYTPEIRQRISESAKRRGISAETREKINQTKRRKAQQARELTQCFTS